MFYLNILLVATLPIGFVLATFVGANGGLPVKPVVVTTFAFALVFIPIDIFMVRKGVWRFDKKLAPPVLFNMPVAEYLFYFTVIPFILILFLFVDHFV